MSDMVQHSSNINFSYANQPLSKVYSCPNIVSILQSKNHDKTRWPVLHNM